PEIAARDEALALVQERRDGGFEVGAAALGIVGIERERHADAPGRAHNLVEREVGVPGRRPVARGLGGIEPVERAGDGDAAGFEEAGPGLRQVRVLRERLGRVADGGLVAALHFEGLAFVVELVRALAAGEEEDEEERSEEAHGAGGWRAKRKVSRRAEWRTP